MASDLSLWKAALPVILYLLTATAVVDAKRQSADAVHRSDAANAAVIKQYADAFSATAYASVERSPVVSEEATASDSSKLPPLIPLPLLLSPGRYKYPQLSPDGRLLAFLQPSYTTGVNSIFVTALPPSAGSGSSFNSSSSSSSSSSASGSAISTHTSSSSSSNSSSSRKKSDSRDKSDSSTEKGSKEISLMARGLLQPRQVTFTSAAVGQYFWTTDSTGIVFVVDSGSGNEDYHLYWVPITASYGSSSSSSNSTSSKEGGSNQPGGGGVTITAGSAVNLTPFKGVKAQGLWLSTTDPGRLLVGLNKRQKIVFDVYSIDLKSAKVTLDTVNPGNVTLWVVTPRLQVGAAVMVGPDGSRKVVFRDPKTTDGCSTAPPPPSTSAATSSANSSSNSSKQQQHSKVSSNATGPSHTSQHTAGDQGAKEHSPSIKQQQQQQPVLGAAADKIPGGSSSSTSIGDGSNNSIGRRRRRLLQQQQQQRQPMLQQAAAVHGLATGSLHSKRSSRQLQQQAPDFSAYADSAGLMPGSGSDNSSEDLDKAIADSSSKGRVACWRQVLQWPFGEDGRVWGFNQAADGLFVTSSLGRDTTELQLISTSADTPGSILERLASHPLVDISEVLSSPANRRPQAVSLDYHTPVWSWTSKEDQQEWEGLEGWRPGEVANPISRSSDKQVWVVEYSKRDGNNAYYLHTRGHFPPMLLFHQQPALLNYTLAPTHPIVVTARDGLRIPGYLTLPVKPGIHLPTSLTADVPNPQSFTALQRGQGTPTFQQQQQQQQQQQGLVDKGSVDWKLPLVLLVHGGPWKRASWGSSAGITQWLANRGYAVLNVNFRGSVGYGKAFSHKGDGQWGVGSMQHDLSDAVAWAVKAGIADPNRVCIMGSSYGGYATFAGMTFTPDLYRCGIAFSGIANLADFARAMPPYWAPIKQRWLRRVGDVTLDASLNGRISPVFHASKIKAPLLIGQGGNDVRVTQGEADAMFQALKREGKQGVQYVLYPDEGHGLNRLANRVDFYSRAEQLLADVLGGRKDKPLSPKATSACVKS